MQQAEFLTMYTQFYYKDARLYFQILVPAAHSGSRLMGEFDDYGAYTKAYDQLQIQLMEQAGQFFLSNKKQGTAKMA